MLSEKIRHHRRGALHAGDAAQDKLEPTWTSAGHVRSQSHSTTWKQEATNRV